MGKPKPKKSQPYKVTDTLLPQPDSDGIYRDEHDTFGTRRGVVVEGSLSPAQQTMRADAARVADVRAESELSREGELHRCSEVIVDNILTGAPKKLRLHPADWAQVRQLVRQAVREGIQLERDL